MAPAAPRGRAPRRSPGWPPVWAAQVNAVRRLLANAANAAGNVRAGRPRSDHRKALALAAAHRRKAAMNINYGRQSDESERFSAWSYRKTPRYAQQIGWPRLRGHLCALV